MDSQIYLKSLRANKARLSKTIGPIGYKLLVTVTGVLLFLALVVAIAYSLRLAAVLAAFGSIGWMIVAWYHNDLALLPSSDESLNGRLSGEVLGRLKVDQTLTPANLWRAISINYQTLFLTNHLLVDSASIEAALSQQAIDMPAIWQTVLTLTPPGKLIEPGYIAAALLASPPIKPLLTKLKLDDDDLAALTNWLTRAEVMSRAEKPYFGGVGRDWAHGFTPRLNRFGQNISLMIEQGGGHFGSLTSSAGVTAMKNAFGQGASAIALIGAPGIGKTSHVYALAQLLLAEAHNPNLEHKQIVALNPSLIISSAQGPGELETIVLSLLAEAAHAGNIVLFFDDAQLFFEDGPGSFDITKILLSAVQSKAVQLVLAMTPNDFQKLKGERSAFTTLLTPVVLTEPPELDVMRVLEDTALNFEGRHHILIAYEALKEAYHLSGRYEQESAYPGKAIQLLEQAIPYGQQGIITAVAVQQAVEQTHGVKVGSAAPVEADTLLNLEAKIHGRMINQERAVKVVSAALRRNRAGVANPKRPIGSFLFLGPTGVGKTELAKAIAAVYFHSETNMVRIDMSEYQQPNDVQRLLSQEPGSLIMAVRQQPFTVLLLDELEKAHPNILNLLLQMLDEGQLTDVGGRRASFKDCIIIATSNAGAETIRQRIEKGESLESFESKFEDELINSNQFKPELLNRFDEIVLFRPLKPEELTQVVGLMIKEVNGTLAAQKISVELTLAAAQKIVEAGYDPRLGARPMRRVLQRAVEDVVANRILAGQAKPGDKITMDVQDLQI